MMKPRYIMLYIMLFSLLILIYFLMLSSLSELIKVSMASLITFSMPLLTLSSITASASVAIFVMKKNHNENINIRERDKLDQDELKIMRSERILHDYRMISGDYSKNINTTSDIQRISINKLLSEVEDIINDCRKVREYDYYYIGDRQVEIFELTDTLIETSKNIELFLIMYGLRVPPNVISEKFKDINSSLEKFFEESKYITS